MRKGGLPAPVQLDWRARTRIAAEVAAGLLHVHTCTWPRLLHAVHGRLQPSNILLGEGLIAKLGDTSLQNYQVQLVTAGSYEHHEPLMTVASRMTATAGPC